MNWEDELTSIAENAHNLALEDSMNERNKIKDISSCLRLSEVIPIIHSLLKQQRYDCIDSAMRIMEMPQYTASMMAGAIQNTPEPTMENK
jgi:hypothetical protein